LLGRVYDWRDGTYCFLEDGDPTTNDMLHCETLEPVNHEERFDVMRLRNNPPSDGREWSDYDNGVKRPWEADDGEQPS